MSDLIANLLNEEKKISITAELLPTIQGLLESELYNTNLVMSKIGFKEEGSSKPLQITLSNESSISTNINW